MFGINGAEFLILLVIAVVVVGPERLPRYAEQLGHGVRRLRHFLGDAKERVQTELGDDAADLDWEALDPRRYDPRRIVREALLDPEPTAPSAGGALATAATAVRSAEHPLPAGAPAPFDDEAT